MEYYKENDPASMVSTCCGEPAFEGPLPKGHKPQGLKRYLLSLEYPICSECMEFADFVQLFYYNKLNDFYPDFKFEGNYTYTNSFYNVSPTPKKKGLH
tara:strand:+ start:1283 stop:1576 length:294 start_codon:yes stop_codon:yes gene_type:complete